MGQREEEPPAAAFEQNREVLEILLESDLYLELPLKERRQLFKHIINEYLYPSSGRPGVC